MKLQILGTAAAEAWPAPFCRCEPCQQARKLGGRNIRSRSGAIIDNDLKIDFCPDTVAQLQRTGRDLVELRALVFTHQHSDHIAPIDLGWTVPPYTQTPPEQPIAVYGNAQVLEILRSHFSEPLKRNLDLHLLEPHKIARTVSGDEILPLPANHVPGALLLRITRGGRHLLYGHDSGLFPEETIAGLAGVPLHAALFDCTHGPQPHGGSHLGVDGVLQTIERLRTVGAINSETILVATHFSHNGALLHDGLVERFAPHGVQVAYDGIAIDV